MLTKLGTQLVQNKACFRRYLRIHHFYFEFELDKYKWNEYHDTKEFERYSNNLMLVSLGRDFFSILTKEEKEAIKYFTDHEKGDTPPENYLIHQSSAYEKWVNIFFKNKVFKTNELDPFVIGGNMKYIRVINNVTKVQLARCLDVDRNTVLLIEKGARLPSLNYIYRFAKLFDYSVDDIIDYYRFLKRKENKDKTALDKIYLPDGL